MKRSIFTRLFPAFLLLVSITSCSDEMMENGSTSFGEQGREVVLPLSIQAMPETGSLETRALTETEIAAIDEDQIKDIWLLEFNSSGLLLGEPKYIENPTAGTQAVPVVLPTADSGETYTLVAIANTHNESWKEKLLETQTLDNLKQLYADARTLNEMYREGSNVLMMSGKADLNHNTGTVTIDLYRNVAKLTVEVENMSTSGVTVNSIQICNVPNKVFYIEQLRTSASPIPTTQEVGFNNFALDKVNITPSSTSDNVVKQSFQYYLSRNCRGEVADISHASQKNTHALQNATYVEVMATKTAGNTPVRYRFYLGENMTTDFNIVNNHHYTLPIKLKAGVVSGDSRVEDMGIVTLGESNSYIINPVTGDAQTLYKLPVFDRINTYWGLNNLEKGVGDVSKKLGGATEWVAEVIWQDVSDVQLIQFCDAKGNEITQSDGQKDLTALPYAYSGTGADYVCFKPTGVTDGSGNKRSGNVLIGVRKKNSPYDDYLWSWHLWITDYNPNSIGASTDGGYTFALTMSDGVVHRYKDGGSNTLWSNNYASSYIMDRNLGAMSATKSDGHAKTGGLYYQFGRKDPFPRTKLYKVDGSTVAGSDPYSTQTEATTDNVLKASANTSTPKSINDAVGNPHTFYSNNGDWATPNPYNSTSFLWNNPPSYTSSSGKSLFDPCPEGWRLPRNGTWAIFSGPNAVSTTYTAGTSTAGYEFYISAKGSGPTAWYPASGYRYSGDGVVYDVGHRGYYWSATAYYASNGFYLYFNSSSVYPSNNYSRAYGFPVRCLKE